MHYAIGSSLDLKKKKKQSNTLLTRIEHENGWTDLISIVQ